MINSIGFSSDIMQKQKQALIQQRYNDIYKHEMAHKQNAGIFGGPIVIEKNSNGIPVGGHVNIKMPALDKKNPDKTIKHADIVIKSALAPSNPSNQDLKVASEARSIKAKAKSCKEENKNSPGQKLNLTA